MCALNWVGLDWRPDYPPDLISLKLKNSLKLSGLISIKVCGANVEKKKKIKRKEEEYSLSCFSVISILNVKCVS